MKNKTNKVIFLPITEPEKKALKQNIDESIKKHRSRKRQKRYLLGIAASLIILFGLTTYFYEFQSNLNDSNDTLPDLVNRNDSEAVQLILGSGENLEINDDQTTIRYSTDGEKVTVGVSKEVNQNTLENNKVSYNTIIVPYGKRSNVQLSDGTKVWLNSGSKLIFPVVFIGKSREVSLEGEAIFEVTHDPSHPFIVNSQDNQVEVLGTVFDVSNYTDDDAFRTILQSGSVQINYGNKLDQFHGEKIRIEPGTMATFNKETKSITSEKVNVANYFSWREGILIVQNNDLKYIMKKISRYYNVEIEIEDESLANETFSGYLDMNENVNYVIQTIKESNNMKYTLDNHKIIINK